MAKKAWITASTQTRTVKKYAALARRAKGEKGLSPAWRNCRVTRVLSRVVTAASHRPPARFIAGLRCRAWTFRELASQG